MSRPGRTRQPCHGCGSTDDHLKGQLCLHCKAIYKDGLTAREKQEHDDWMPVMHTTVSHLISRPYLRGYSNTYDVQKVFDRIWADFTMALTEPIIGDHQHRVELIQRKEKGWRVKGESLGFQDSRQVRPKVYLLLNQLADAWPLMLEMSYILGFLEGSRLLDRFRAGDATVRDMEDRLEKLRAGVLEVERSAAALAEAR